MVRVFIVALLFSAWPVFAEATPFTLSSSDVAEGQPLGEEHVFKGFGCDGKNASPHLAWSGVPEGTRSFAVTVYDPDAPTGSGWWHWMAFDIPPDTTQLPHNASATDAWPKGARQARNDYGAFSFGGACPPPGEVHRYQFTIFALGVERLDVPDDASAALIGFMIRASSLANATITAVYTR